MMLYCIFLLCREIYMGRGRQLIRRCISKLTITMQLYSYCVSSISGNYVVIGHTNFAVIKLQNVCSVVYVIADV